MKLLQGTAERAGFVAALGAVLVSLAGCSNSKSSNKAGAKRLDGAGSSFVKPIMNKWVIEYKKEKGLEIDYKSAGSGAGIQQMTSKTVAFGATDAPMDANQLEEAKKNGGDVVHIPLVIGGAVAAYNLPEVEQPLKFTGPLLADIFLGKVTKWNDEALQKVNPGVKFPDKNIIVVVRSDPSGTNYIWTDYLSKVAKDWNLGVSVKVEWPKGETAKGSEGMAGKLKTPGTIGYVELLYALQNEIQYGHIQNKEGEFIKPDLESVKIAAHSSLSGQPIPENLCYSITNAAGKGAYPISGTTWAVLYAKQPQETGQELVKFLRWVTHDGQKYCDSLNYVQLPSTLVEKIDKKLDSIEFVK
jgi:phosphate transport system substrate-binding protein